MTQPTPPVERRIGSRLDPHVGSYAARTRGMSASEIRALFSVASRPEVVSLAGGAPYLPALPLDAVAALVNEVVTGAGTVALQYGPGQGEARLREQITTVMALEGIAASADDVVVTVGSQQGLDLVTRIFIDPGDVVVAEAPSYVGALSTFAAYQAEVVHVAIDDDGLVPEALREALAALAAAGRRVKFLYTVPNYHNPAGVTLAAARRGEILEMCRRAGVLVVEDDPYGLLGFDGDAPAAMRSLDADNVVYLGSFSKTFAPGLRVGWALAPPAIREKLVLASEAAVLCPPSFSQYVVSRYLEAAPWQEQIKVFREVYRERRDAMLCALRTLFPPGASWTIPHGGFYVWLRLPEGLDAKAMLPRAVQARVAYVPGRAFYADDNGVDHLRLSYCYPEPERIVEGVRRLVGVVEDELELRDTFGTATVPHPTPGPQGPGPGLA